MPYNQPHSHIPFILKPATDTVKEALGALNATSGGIETYPLCGYLMQSLFLNLTGSQEQKLKCICWEMACRDYEYRYERFERSRYSECSDYDDKSMVYKDLISQIAKHGETFVVTDAMKDDILSDWKSSVIQLFERGQMSNSYRKKYEEFKSIAAIVKREWIMNNTQLFTNKDNISAAERVCICGLGLQEVYKKYVYVERNRCAHNTRSYQHNLPSLKGMMADDYKLQNYFLYIAVMLLLDMIYVKLFKKYLEVMGYRS